MTELTYLQTTSAMEFFTNLSPQLGWTFHLKFRPMAEADWDGDGFPTFFGNMDNGFMVRGRYGGFSRTQGITYGNAYYDGEDDWEENVDYDVIADASGFTLNGVRHTYENGTIASEMRNSDKMFINACNGGGDEAIRKQSARYKFIGVYDSGGTAVAEYIPVLDENDVCCFYDRIGGNYIYNSGSGTPISGDVKTPFTAVIEGDITAEEGNYEVKVTTSSNWTASTSASYVSFISGNNLVSAVTGTAINSSCTVNIIGNSGSTDRNVEINFVNADGDTYVLNATQPKPQTNIYVFCDYIQGQYGIGGSYLDLGIKPSLDMEIEMAIQNNLREQGSSNDRIIGNGESGGLELYSRLDEYCVLNFGDQTGIGSDYSMLLPQSLSKIDIKINSTAMTRTWNNIPRTNTYNATELTGTTNNLMLNGDSGSTCNAMRYGEIIIRKSGVVVFDGKPCVYGSQVGLYDIVNDEFIPSQGKSFLAVDKYGVIMGGEEPEAIIIGEDEVVRIYIGDILVYMVVNEQPTPPAPEPSGWTVLTSSLSTSLPISKIRMSAPSEAYGNFCFSLVSGQTLWFGQEQNDCENINTAERGWPWENRIYCNDPNNDYCAWVLDNGDINGVSYDGTEYTFSGFKYLCAFDSQGVADALDSERNVEVYIGTPPPTPVVDAISVSDDQNNNEVAFSVGFTSSTYNSIWEAQIDNTAYDDAISQGIDPDDIDWVISQGWENTNEGNPRDAGTNTPCDGYVKVYFFLYDNVNDSVSTATTWSNTYYGNGDCEGGGGDEPTPEECTEWVTCDCCGGSGEQDGEPCPCCDGQGGHNETVPCP